MKSFRKIDESNYTKIGIILIFTGFLFGLDKIFGIEIFNKLWPLLILILGIGFIGIFKHTKIRGALYLIIGEIFILFSCLAIFCNFYTWNILINLWPVFITFLGVILFTLYILNRDKKGILLSAITAILISVYFYLYINYDSSFWWTLLIIGGISLIAVRKKQ